MEMERMSGSFMRPAVKVLGDSQTGICMSRLNLCAFGSKAKLLALQAGGRRSGQADGGVRGGWRLSGKCLARARHRGREVLSARTAQRRFAVGQTAPRAPAEIEQGRCCPLGRSQHGRWCLYHKIETNGQSNRPQNEDRTNLTLQLS